MTAAEPAGEPPVSVPVTVAPMTTADIVLVLPYEEALFGSERWTAETYRSELADRRHRHYVVARTGGGALQGWAGLLVVGETAQILTIATVPAAQRRGVGQTLLSALIAQATVRGAREVLLEVRIDNAAAIRLYERNGFSDLRIRRGYYDLGRVDAREMRRGL